MEKLNTLLWLLFVGVSFCFGLQLNQRTSQQEFDSDGLSVELVESFKLRKQRRDFYRSCRESNSPLNTELTRDIKSLSDAIKKYEDEKITQILLSNFAKKYFHYEPGTFVKSDKFFQQELFTLLEKEKSWFLEYGLPTKSISVPLNPTEEKNKGTAIVLGGSSDLNSQIKLSGTETIICCYEKKLVALDMASESAFWFYFDD